MTPEEKALLERTFELVKENNELLRSLKNRARLGTAIKIVYWVVIIALSLGATYFFQSYLDTIKSAVTGSPGANAMEQNVYTNLMKDLTQ